MGIFGIDDSDILSGETLSDVLVKWGNLITDEIIQEIRNKTSEGTSKGLEQSVNFLPVKIDGNVYTLEFVANDYFKYVDQGVRGAGGRKKNGGVWRQKNTKSPFAFSTRKPPVNFSDTGGASLRQWSYNKNLNEYAVREGIFRQGIAARDILDGVVTNDLMNKMINDIADTTGRMIEVSISEGFE